MECQREGQQNDQKHPIGSETPEGFKGVITDVNINGILQMNEL